MLPILKPTTTFMAFVLFYVSSLHVVKAVPAPGALGFPRPVRREARDCANEPPDSLVKKNGLDAQKLNQDFKWLQPSDSCGEGQTACIQSQLAQCIYGRWNVVSCGSGRECFAFPFDNEPGTSIECEVQSIAEARFDSACMEGGPYGSFLAPRHYQCKRDGLTARYEECEPDGPSEEYNKPADPPEENEEPADGSSDGGYDCIEESEELANADPVNEEDDCEEEDPPSLEPPSRGDVNLITFTRTITLSPTESSGNPNFEVGRRQIGSRTSDPGVPVVTLSRQLSTGSFVWDATTRESA